MLSFKEELILFTWLTSEAAAHEPKFTMPNAKCKLQGYKGPPALRALELHSWKRWSSI